MEGRSMDLGQSAQAAVTVRPMLPGDRLPLTQVLRRSFPWFQRLFFSWTPDTLVAEKDGRPVGAVVLKRLSLERGRTGAFLSWIFVDPDCRGLGAAQALTEAALALCEERGWSEVLACVEGLNPSSSKLLATRGFSLLSPGQQLRRFGRHTPLVWMQTLHWIDVGHFLWRRPAEASPDRPWLQWWGSVAANTAVLGLLLWRLSGFHSVHLPTLGRGLALITLLFGLRTGAMAAAARAWGWRVRYRAWESGFPLSAAVALTVGGWFPIPGGLYPAEQQWRYRERLSGLSVMALAGVTIQLLALGCLPLVGGGIPLAPWLMLARVLAVPLLVVDLLPFFPFVGFSGRRLWDRSPALWALVAAAAAATIRLAR